MKPRVWVEVPHKKTLKEIADGILGGPRKPGKRRKEHKRTVRYRKSAEARGYEWALTTPQAVKMFRRDCHYCGAHPEISRETGKKRLNGIDRVDNTKGYTKDNCVTCCKMCNRMKSAYTLVEFLNKIKRIASKQKLLDTSI